MKKITIFMLAMAATIISTFSGTFPNDPRSFPVLIAHAAGIGSGCLMQLSNSVYLVTVKHVLFANQDGTNTPTLLSQIAVLKSYSGEGTNVSERTLALNLSELFKAGEIRCSTNHDVAIVRIENCSTTNPEIVTYLPGVIVPSNEQGLATMPQTMVSRIAQIDVGADVYMFGYPVSLTAPISGIFNPSEPLLRKGIVAGVNQRNRKVIIDCPSYQGNSGGPVLEIDRPALGTVNFRIIGVVTGFVPFQEEWENKTLHYSHVLSSNSGYTILEPMDTILELVWK